MSTAAQLLSLSKRERRRVQELQRIRPLWNLVGLLHLAMPFGCALAATAWPVWPVQIATVVLVGFSFNALGVLLHETLHGSFFRRQGLDRAAGILFGIPILFSATAYKTIHLRHHRYTRTQRDPDDPLVHEHRSWIHTLNFFAWILIGSAFYVLTLPVRAWRVASRRDRVWIGTECAAILLVFATAISLFVAHGAFGAFLRFWALPYLVAVWINNVHGWAEHQNTVHGNPLTHTRTVTSNRLCAFLLCNIGYHIEHHLFPAVPWYHLPRLHALLGDRLRTEGAFVERSYLRFLWRAVRAHGSGPVPSRPS